LGDFAGGGLMLALGVVSALYERAQSGRGQVVDAAMVDGAALLTTFLHGMHGNGMWDGERGTNMLEGAASFYDTYETADGKFMAVGCVEPKFYAEFLTNLEIDAPDLPFQLDATAWPQMKKLIGDTFGQKTRAEWTEIFADSDACVSPVLSPWEAHEHPHNRAMAAFVEVDGVLQPAPAPRFSRSESARPVGPDHGGRDVSATLAAWGFGDEAIARLRDSGTVC
jgi:alpha-methylacyl-CoA racemase